MDPSATGHGHTLHLDLLAAALGHRYRLEREIGAGGMATVFLAEDLKHHRKVAIKVLDPALAAGVGAERFLREIDIAAMLTHPHILPLHDSGEVDGLLFYVMPFVEGESLRERLAREGRLPVPEVLRILGQLADALAYAHQHGVVHRDVKPGNVMLAGKHALVADFGIAKAVSDASDPTGVTAFGMVVGTPHYMAPEQAAGDTQVDHRADIYAVGVVAYEMLTGRTPFSGNTAQVLLAHLNTPPEPVATLRPGISQELAGVVMRCLEKLPGDRWQSAGELLSQFEALATPGEGTTVTVQRPAVRAPARRWGWVAAGAVAVVALVGAWRGGLFGLRRDARWVHGEAIPHIQALADSDRFIEATQLAMEANAVAPEDPALIAVWRKFARRAPIASTPPGATVSWRDDDGKDGPWRPLGKTPLEMWFPRGNYRLRLEFAGHQPLEVVAHYWWLRNPDWAYPLDPVGTVPDGVVHVPGGRFDLSVEGAGEPLQLSDFLIDRFEVTNRRFKAFVAAGGYEDPSYWKQPFVFEGRVLPWKEAMARFRDRTNRSGPSTWELSGHPKGQEEHPVGGISWYEAAAFAVFEHRELPTVYHWQRAAGPSGAGTIAPLGNFADRGSAPVGQYRALSRFGAWDMAGNVREWCFNEIGAGEQRAILGGGWNDAPYQFVDLYGQSPWDRSATNGVRLVSLKDEPGLEKARKRIVPAFRDYSKERPVGDAEFAVYRRLYAYDKKPLNAAVERTDVAEEWTREKVSFDAAYPGERVVAYIHLPRKGTRPFQTVVYFPGSDSIFLNSIEQDFNHWDPIVRSGRALVFPIYKGTFERKNDLSTDLGDGTIRYRDRVIEWSRDLQRTLDYIESRADLDAQHIGYFGHSWGATMGGIIPAVEPRLKAAVLHVAGLAFERPLPEADAINFLPRVTIPVLMLNGRYDGYFPLETSQIPMFQLLGTPSDRKRHLIYEAGHVVPRAELIKETLDWYDRYLGPVGKAGNNARSGH